MRVLLGTVSLLFLLYTLSTTSFSSSILSRRAYNSWTDNPYLLRNDHASGDVCAAFPKHAFDSIQVVLKIGAAEVDSKLPAHLRTVSSCVPDLLIFSDFEEDIGRHHLYDALANLQQPYRSANPDFDIYEKIRQQRSAGKPLSRSSDGWKLDKYKFFPMMEMVWDMRQHKKWFLFIELDTYVVWDNLFRWLSHQDPSQALYVGSPVWPKDKPVFAHGGSGIILSQGTLHTLASKGQKMRVDGLPGSHQFGQDLREECCGDEVLAKVLSSHGIFLKGYWPMINGEKATTVRFGKNEQWCEPVITLHHLSEDDLDDMWHWEMKRHGSLKPLLFEELFLHIEPSLAPQRTNWTNLSEDIRITSPDLPGQSLEECARACSDETKCYQYQYRKDTCDLSYTFRLGYSQHFDYISDQEVTSGWILERIAEFKKYNSPCREARWVHSNP
ncbi:glycosyltransferase family 31 protein [Glonium stellatum]|uniref:N-acetylgalactosaminide beta-1,3-galactosyltransferase n=1 Tax=Glonium stellatum TaxID=574774 RepID=A0A8E2F4N0_9PEZI|nr:glycosyltransferase family 31 protein [Glonium stellatum]